MRYQERIYIRNDFNGVRNKDILNVSMSSDFGIFKSPVFELSGATKVPCGTITCDFSGVPFNNIFNSAATECLTATTTVVNTFLSADWHAKIYEDNSLTYSGHFYTSSFSGDLPTNTMFLTAVTSGLTVLDYTFKQDGTKVIVDKKYGGTKLLEYDICIGFDINRYTCPVGFSATPANDGCEKIEYTAATFNGTGATINAGNTDSAYINYGTYFYPSIQSGVTLPVYYIGNLQPLKDSDGNTITPLNTVVSGNTFWSNFAVNTVDGRLNQIGLSASSTEWLGFSKCVDIETPGTYYIGLAADNDARFRVDGVLYVSLSGSQSDNLKKWSVFPFYLESGLHIIEMEGINSGAATAFGAEIYNPINYQTLTGATSTGQTGLIFSTAEYRGNGRRWELGETIEYSCPAGYPLNTCTSAYTCSKIIKSAITATTAHCLDDCIVYCGDSFPYVDNNTIGTYIIDPSVTTEIPLTFNFTGNTTSFLLNDTSFKYEIYKYRDNLGIFTVPAVYKSGLIPYSAITSGYTLQQSIPISGLQLDGQYLIKGYFEANAPTTYLKKLNKKIDTSVYKQNGQYQLYDANLDYYIVATTKAETPNFLGLVQTSGETALDSFYQQVIIVDDAIYGYEFVEVFGPDETNNNVYYYRTGSTFTLSSEYIGDVFVTLNGLTLSKDIDYSLSGTLLTIFGPITNGDIITIIYTRTIGTNIISEAILLDSAIQSGTTNNQGSNRYYFNTTTGKYEIYLTNEPVEGTNILISLNGIILANNIDYYQSVTNNKRIILTGILMVDDIITAIYYPKATIINGITQTNNNIFWFIQNGPIETNGTFTLEYSNNINFLSSTISAIVPYQQQVTNYGGVLSLTGSIGTTYYYRVKNEKNNVTICGDIISSTAYSETVKVVIESNGINSY
jgi:hypothetical protein